MRTLVVYYSLSGNTRKVAETAARELGADIAQVKAPHGLYAARGAGFWRAIFHNLLGRQPAIEVVGGGQPEGYDLVVVLAPVWASHAAAPIRTYLAQSRGRLGRAALVLTCGARGRAMRSRVWRPLPTSRPSALWCYARRRSPAMPRCHQRSRPFSRRSRCPPQLELRRWTRRRRPSGAGAVTQDYNF